MVHGAVVDEKLTYSHALRNERWAIEASNAGEHQRAAWHFMMAARCYRVLGHPEDAAFQEGQRAAEERLWHQGRP